MSALQVIAMLCQIHTGSPTEANQVQATCQAYFSRCLIEEKSRSPKNTEQENLLICMSVRPTETMRRGANP